MATSIDSNYYVQKIFYNPYKKVEKKNSETNIWAKEKNNSSKTETKILDDCELAKKIHSNSGLFSSSKKLNEYIENINADNVINIVESYKRWYGKSIFNEIMRNIFISSDTRAEAVKHIKDMLMQAMKRSGTYTEDYDKLIDGHIDYEKNKFSRMNSKLIDRDMRFLTDRYKQTKHGKNTLYQANGKIDAEFNQGNYVFDCWIISTVKSLSINTKGLEMLEDLISIDDKGNVTVKLKGVSKEYTISKEELEGANELAQGDLDVRAIEIAIGRYFHEIEDHANLIEKGKNRFSDVRIHNSDDDIYFCTHSLSTTYYMLFGKPLISDIQPNKKTIEQIKSDKYTTIVASYNNHVMNGFTKAHAYAVIGADDNFVYLSNPYFPNYNLSTTHSDFLKFFDASYSTKLSD